MSYQLDLLPLLPAPAAAPAPTPRLDDYDTFVVFFSGGKDSVACVLHLLDLGVPTEKIELHHHRVDGEEPGLFDWPCTDAYLRAFADTLGLKLYFSWKKGGFEREMTREGEATAPICFETPEGDVRTIGGAGKPNTRLMYPQVTASLLTRWCSGYLKNHVGSAVLVNCERFQGTKTLVVTGERAEESANRAQYAVFTTHETDLREPKQKNKAPRWIDHFRPVHAWGEREVWEMLRTWGIVAHPAYHLGFGRCSCMTCIFLNDADWRRLYAIDPERIERHMAYEERFGKTIHRTRSIRQRIAHLPEPSDLDPHWVAAALSHRWDPPIRIPTDEWALPSGAYRKTGGPT